MTVEQALSVVKDKNSSLVDCTEAANVLAESPETPLDYLVECLNRKGLCAEIAAMKLYLLTKRPRLSESTDDVVLDFDDWRAYLREQGFVK